MKSKLMWFTAITLFAALAFPVRLAAQDNEDHNNRNKHHHYKFIDIGSLGGPNSYFSAGGHS